MEKVKLATTTHIIRRCSDCPYMEKRDGGTEAFCAKFISVTKPDIMPLWCRLDEVGWDLKSKTLELADGHKYVANDAITITDHT